MAKYKNFSDARNLRPKIVDARYNCRNMIFISLEVERPIVKDSVGAKPRWANPVQPLKVA